MKKYNYKLPEILGITFLLILVGIGNVGAQITGDYPYFESFLSGSKPADVFVPDPTKNTVQFKTKGAVLTPEPATLDKFGALILNDHSFDSYAGIFVSFEYMIYGGSGGDGLSVFFYDANVAPSIGATGRAIGYNCNRSFNGTAEVRPGVWVDMRDYRAQGLTEHILELLSTRMVILNKPFIRGKNAETEFLIIFRVVLPEPEGYKEIPITMLFYEVLKVRPHSGREMFILVLM